MLLQKVKLKNFKSFYNLELQLNSFSVFLGANGSGKSNFVDSLKFMKESLNNNVSYAVGNRFGWKNLLSKGKKSMEKLELEFDFNLEHINFEVNEKEFEPISSNYLLTLRNIKNITFVNEEELKTNFILNNEKLRTTFNRNKRKVNVINDIAELSPTDIKKETLTLNGRTDNKLFLDANFVSIANLFLSDTIKNWRFYNIDHNLARKPSNSENDMYLNEDGSNLALILHTLQHSKNKDIKKRIENLMKLIIPSFSTWKVERQFDASLGYKIMENDNKNDFLPKMISDGTIRLLSTLVALLYQENETKLIAVDEPERGLHPQSLQTLVEVMRETSKHKQIIVTTHSPEIVKWLKPNEIYLVDKIDGQTKIIHGSDIDNINSFLDEFTFDELWLSGYIKGGSIR